MTGTVLNASLLVCNAIERTPTGHNLLDVHDGRSAPRFPVTVFGLGFYVQIAAEPGSGSADVSLQHVSPRGQRSTLAQASVDLRSGFHAVPLARDVSFDAPGDHRFELRIGGAQVAVAPYLLVQAPVARVFGLLIPVPELPALLARAGELFPREYLEESVDTRVLAGGGLHPIAIPYSNTAAYLSSGTLTVAAFEGQGTITRQLAAGWSAAELAYWTMLAEADRNRSLRCLQPRNIGPPALFEVETELRYLHAGFETRTPSALASGQRGEFELEVLGKTVHVECKHVDSVLDPTERDRLVELHELATAAARGIVGRHAEQGIFQVALRLHESLPDEETLIHELDLLAYTAREARRQDDPCRAWARDLPWGRVSLRVTPEVFFGDAAGHAQYHSHLGIHPFDGYVVAREWAPEWYDDPRALLRMPLEIIVAIGPLPTFRIDNLVKKSFEKAQKKIRGSGDLLMIHIRLAVPEILRDLPRPFGARPELRRSEAIEVALRRIGGLWDRVPDNVVGVEVSTLVSQGVGPRDAYLYAVNKLTPNPNCSESQTIIRELQSRGVIEPGGDA